MRLPLSHVLPLLLTAAPLLSGCGPLPSELDEGASRTPGADHPAQATSAEDQAPSFSPERQIIRLTLNKRAGRSDEGWSFASQSLVPADQADLTLSSADCGARGRWVFLEIAGQQACAIDQGIRCQDFSTCGAASIEIGGSSPRVEIGQQIALVDDAGVLSRVLELVDRTQTPFEWYETPDAPFEVVLDGGALND